MPLAAGMDDTTIRFSDRPIEEQWARLRQMIADGHEGSYPREWFEALHEPGARFEVDGVECVVVPVEPTEKMLKAVSDRNPSQNADKVELNARLEYTAMINAASQ